MSDSDRRDCGGSDKEGSVPTRSFGVRYRRAAHRAALMSLAGAHAPKERDRDNSDARAFEPDGRRLLKVSAAAMGSRPLCS